MLAAKAQFRRVKGHQELRQLALALERATAEEPGCSTCHRLSMPDRSIRHGGPTESDGERDNLRRDPAAPSLHLASRYLEQRRARYLGRPLARFLGWSGAHRYVRFERAARALLPLLPPDSPARGERRGGADRTGRVRWLPLLAIVVVMPLQALVIGLQSRS